MASTYKFSDATTMISAGFSRNLETGHVIIASNMALNLIWQAFDWPFSLKTLPPFWLVPYEQDYGPPQVAVPSDYQGLRQVRLVHISTGDPSKTPLTVHKDLELTGRQGLPEAICYNPDTTSFRVYPKVPPNCGSPYYLIEGNYKKFPTKITTANFQSTSLPLDDIYLSVWLESLKWALKALQGSPEAGQMLVANGNVQYSGQMATALASIKQMAQDTGLQLGDSYLTPFEPLVGSTRDFYV